MPVFQTRVGRRLIGMVRGLISLLFGLHGTRQRDKRTAAELRELNAQLERQAAQRTADLARALEITKVVTASMTVHDVLDSIVQSAFHLYTGLHNVHIFLKQHDDLLFGIGYWHGVRQQEPIADPRPDGLTATVASSGQLLHIPDMRQHPIFADTPDWTGEIVGIPLKIGNKVVGVLNLSYPEPNTLPPAELPLLQLLGDQIAIAIEHANLFNAAQQELAERRRAEEQLRQQNTQLALMQMTMIELLGSRDPHQLLAAIVARVGELLGTTHGFVYLLDPAGQMTCVVGVGIFQKDIGLQAQPGVGVAGQVWQTQQPLPVADYDTWVGRIPWRPKGRLKEIAGVPLLADNQFLGVLGVGYPPGAERPFGAQELELLTHFARLAAITLQNARLFEAEQLARRTAETLREAGAAVATTLHQGETIQLILEQLKRVVHFDEASVMLLQDQQLILSATTQQGRYAPQQPFPLERLTAAREVLQQRAPIIIEDTHASPLWSPLVTNPARSWLGVPLIAKGAVIGILNIAALTPKRFTEHDQVIALSFADQVSIAIENARLFEAAQQELAERRRAEEQLRQAKEEAEAATRTKSVFLATMSHEIRTPMNGVLGLADVLLDTPLSADQRQIIEMIRTSGDTLLRVIDDILDFSKIEAGRLEIEHQPFDLRQCLMTALDLVRPRAIKKRLDLSVLVDVSAPQFVIGDRTRFQQILINLLNNATKFTEQGEIELTLTCEWLTEGSASYRIFCAVRDTGIGIPPARMGRLFQSFSQIDASTTRTYGGTGLGLAICKLLCELMGGEIWAESTPGAGSIFCFTVLVGAVEDELLAAQQRTSRSAGPAPAAAERRLATRLPLRVLLAEDNAINQHVATLMLQRLGYQPDIATNGHEVLTALSSQPYDLILMDMQMPEMDGLEATRQIRARHGDTQRPIIIALTANAMQGDRERCLAAGMNDYLSKPLRQHELREMLERWGTQIHAQPEQHGEGDNRATIY